MVCHEHEPFHCPYVPCPYSCGNRNCRGTKRDCHQMTYGIFSKPYLWDTIPKSFGPCCWGYFPSKDDWNKYLERELEKKYQEKARRKNNDEMNWICSWLPLQCLGHSTKPMATELQEIQPLTKPTPPEAAVRDFKNIVVSFHFPKEILSKPECVPNPAEWFVELRQYFVDLPQQLGQLEQFAMTIAGTGTGTTATTTADHDGEDARSLAHWKDYQVPDGAAGESVVKRMWDPHQSRYPNLKCTRRIVFSQRAKDGKWLTGRWMAVAYVFASTPEALEQLDWCQLISPDTMADLHAYNVGPKKLEVSYTGELRKFYQLERKRPEYVYQYGGRTSSQQQPQSHCTEEKKKKKRNETMQTTARAKSDEEPPEDDDEGTTLEETQLEMVPTVWQLVSTPCAAPWGERSPPKQASGDVRIPSWLPIPTELEDRCHIYDVSAKHSGPVPYHATNMAVPPGMAIPQVLEDRCRLVDRTWPSLMRGGAAATPDAEVLDKEWDLI